MNRFSIILPTYNRAELLRSALQSVQALRIPPEWDGEILVIDNNSTDHTPAVALASAREGPLAVRHIVETTQGLNHGRNRGMREAAYEHLVYLDDDMLVDPGWLEGYAKAQAELAPDAVVGPVEPMYEEPPAEWLTPRMIESVTSSYSLKGERVMLVPLGQAHELPGCNFAVRRQVALGLGGFHPSLDRCGAQMLAGGDSELGERLGVAGKRIAYSPACKIRHLISRQKISRAGMRARWEGLGATSRALMRLRGKDLSTSRRLRLFMRMLRFYGRSALLRVTGDSRMAFHWELEALKLRGLLLRGPKNLAPRPRT